jgi:exodeoxyribonuclease VII small subunit
MSKKNTSIEENFAKLEGTLALLESDDISLEQAFAAYSDGMKLLKQCNDQIDKVEKQVLKLSADGTLTELE